MRPGKMGKESCIAVDAVDAVDAAAYTKETGNGGGEGERCRGDQKRRKPDRNARMNASCYGATRPRRLSRERVSELSLESSLCLAAVKDSWTTILVARIYAETGLLYIIHP